MDQKDRLAYEVAMATLRDTREDCLRWLEDQGTSGRPPTPGSLVRARIHVRVPRGAGWRPDRAPDREIN